MRPEAEPDFVDRRFVMGVALAALAITALACLVAWGVLRSAIDPALLASFHRTRTAAPRAAVSQLESSLFGARRADTETQPERARAKLKSYGWSQREAGLVHVPIERAFALYLSGMRAPSAAAPTGSTR